MLYIQTQTSLFLLSVLLHHFPFKVFHFKSTYCIRRKRISGNNMTGTNAKDHTHKASVSTYLCPRNKCCCENLLSRTVLASKHVIIGKYTCLSPRTRLPSVLSANLNTPVTSINICNLEIVHWPTVQHAHWLPSNLTWA